MKLHKKVLIMIAVILMLLGYKSQYSQAEVLAKFHNITFLTPINNAPDGDRFKYQNTANLSGRIAYSPTIVKPEQPITQYVVVRKLLNGKEVSVRSLPVQTSLSLYDVQFSPDGKVLGSCSEFVHGIN